MSSGGRGGAKGQEGQGGGEWEGACGAVRDAARALILSYAQARSKVAPPRAPLRAAAPAGGCAWGAAAAAAVGVAAGGGGPVFASRPAKAESLGCGMLSQILSAPQFYHDCRLTPLDFLDVRGDTVMGKWQGCREE